MKPRWWVGKNEMTWFIIQNKIYLHILIEPFRNNQYLFWNSIKMLYLDTLDVFRIGSIQNL